VLYEKTVLTELSALLGQYYGDLSTEADNLQTAAAKLTEAWKENEGLVAFKISKGNWDNKFGQPGDTGPDTALGKIKALSQAVDAALNNAVAADTKVAQAFG
jgi:hypothetical protein